MSGTSSLASRSRRGAGSAAFGLVSTLIAAVLVASAGLVSSPASAQNPSLDVRIVTGATNRPTGGLLTAVSVVNTGNEPLANVQLVVRVPALPAQIQNVTEASAPLVDSFNRAGVVDERTGFWYHTVVAIPVGGSVHFNVNWYNPCAGRWPFAARAGDRRTFVSMQFAGGSLPTCGPDDVASPTPASWFDLPWPPSVPATTSTTSTTTSSTVPGATVPGTVLPTVPVSSVPGTPSSLPPAPAPSSSVVTPPTTVKPPASSTSRKPTTTRRPVTTLEIVCKTVGGRRYCGPKSSALKPGQAKPRSVSPTTKKKSKS